MPRPQFTEVEQTMIKRICRGNKSRLDVFLSWFPWLFISSAVFFYGLVKHIDAFIFAGFAVELYLLCYVVYQQVKHNHRVKQIIEKYESSFH